ncbi:MAG: hypothetical protein NW220_11340, partial [Leptolyngbyaceae cyanobacterium bins.349]|nr:hypothetical protein [Leptolyngbyaceae cyanobacterium bins.349]
MDYLVHTSPEIALYSGQTQPLLLGGPPPKPPEVEDGCVPHTPSRGHDWGDAMGLGWSRCRVMPRSQPRLPQLCLKPRQV